MNDIVRLKWDSEFFGFKTGKLATGSLNDKDLTAVLEDAAAKGFHIVYWFADASPENDNAAAFAGGLLVDRKCTYLRSLQQIESTELQTKFNVERYPVAEPTADLLQLAHAAGAYSRFLIDPRFGRPAFERLYREWMRNSCLRQLAEEVFVINRNDHTRAMITVGQKNGRADIGLVATDQSSRGTGMGSDLVRAFLKWGLDEGFSEAQVVTQRENLGACRLYEKNGFELESEVHVYHFWL